MSTFIKKILATISASVFLYGGGCGIDGDGMDWSSYSCGAQDTHIERTILKFLPDEAALLCKYGKIDKKENVGKVIAPGCLGEYRDRVKASGGDISLKHGSLDDKIKSGLEIFSERVKNNGPEGDSSLWDKVIQGDEAVSNLSALAAKVKEINNNPESKAQAQSFASIVQNANIDSHTNYKNTLAAIVTAVFTADPDYFINGYTNAMGELQLKTPSNFQSANSEFIQDWMANASGGNFSSMLDFMDPQALGYFVRVIQLLRKVYNEILFMALIIAATFSIGYFSYKKKMEKYGKEPYNVNKMGFTVSAMFAFLFFSAPLINDGNINTSGFTLSSTTGSGGQVENWTTLGQETLRYTAQTGNYFANMANDYIMQAYLFMVGKKQGFLDMTEDDIYSLAGDLNNIEAEKAKLLASLNFYNNICVPYYLEDDDELFNSSEEGSKNSTFVTKDTNDLLSHREFKDDGTVETTTGETQMDADRLSYNACYLLQKEIVDRSNYVAFSSASLQNRIKNYTEILNGNGEALKRMKGFVELNAWAAREFGWMSSAFIPISYYFFDNSEVFTYDAAVDDEGRKAIFKDAAIRKVKNISKDFDTRWEEDVQDASDSVALGIAQTPIVSGLTYSSFFLLPGFSDTYGFIRNKIAGGRGDDVMDSLGSKKTKSSGLLKKVFNFAKNKGGVTGMLLSGVGTAVAFFVAIKIYLMGITLMSMVVISALIVFKITLYFIADVMVLFLIIPLKGIYYALLSPGQGRNYLGLYASSLVGVFVTPLLITLGSGVLIPAYEFFKSFFGAITGAIEAVILGGTDMVRMAGVLDKVDGIWDRTKNIPDELAILLKKLSFVIGLESLSTAIATFSMVVVSFFILISIRGWFNKMMGLDAGPDSVKEGVGEIRQGAVGRMISPVS